jgi:hypothetical protein
MLPLNIVVLVVPSDGLAYDKGKKEQAKPYDGKTVLAKKTLHDRSSLQLSFGAAARCRLSLVLQPAGVLSQSILPHSIHCQKNVTVFLNGRQERTQRPRACERFSAWTFCIQRRRADGELMNDE